MAGTDSRAHVLPATARTKSGAHFHVKGNRLSSTWQIVFFFFFFSAIFILLNFHPLKRKRELTMEKTKHNGTRGRGAVLSNKHFLGATPQEQLILPRKGAFPVPPPLITVKFPL